MNQNLSNLVKIQPTEENHLKIISSNKLRIAATNIVSAGFKSTTEYISAMHGRYRFLLKYSYTNLIVHNSS